MFKVGDLILFPSENSYFDTPDYGVITKVEPIPNHDGNYYHIYWALEKETQIEEDGWAEENFNLIAEAKQNDR